MASPTAMNIDRISGIAGTIGGAPITNNGFMTINLPNTAQAGNSIIVGLQYGSGSVTHTGWAVTDDKGNTYTGVEGGHDVGNAQSCCAFYCVGLASGAPKQIRIQNISGASLDFFQPSLFEANDLTAIDGTNKNNGSSTTPTGGSITPTQTGDFFVMYVARTSSVGTTSFAATSQANMTWRMLCADLTDGDCMQSGVYASTVAISASCTMGTTSNWVTVTMAFKAGTAGSPKPTNVPYINGIHHTNVRSVFADPYTLQLPAVGNLIVCMQSGGNAGNGQTVRIADTNGNSWQTGQTITNDASEQVSFVVRPVTSDTLKVTFDVNTGGGDVTFMMYDVSVPGGVKDKPLDQIVTASGNQAASGNLTSISISPRATGMVLGMVSQSFGTENGITDTAMVFDAVIYDGESVDGPMSCDENNGWAHIFNTDLTTRTFTWTKTAASAAAQAWESSAVAFDFTRVFDYSQFPIKEIADDYSARNPAP